MASATAFLLVWSRAASSAVVRSAVARAKRTRYAMLWAVSGGGGIGGTCWAHGRQRTTSP
jgi:hypothetical protein